MPEQPKHFTAKMSLQGLTAVVGAILARFPLSESGFAEGNVEIVSVVNEPAIENSWERANHQKACRMAYLFKDAAGKVKGGAEGFDTGNLHIFAVPSVVPDVRTWALELGKLSVEPATGKKGKGKAKAEPMPAPEAPMQELQPVA